MDNEEIQIRLEVGDQLTSEDVKKLIACLHPPAGMVENVTDGHELLYILKQWPGHDSYKFDQALSSIGRADLRELARKLPWLSSEHPNPQKPTFQPELSLKTFVNILKTDIQNKEWLSLDINPRESLEKKIDKLIVKDFITANLDNLIGLMRSLKREDLASSIAAHKVVFVTLSDHQFKKRIRKEVESQDRDLQHWEKSLRFFVETYSKKVKQSLDDADFVDLESVYVPLTVLKEKPKALALEDETTHNEISFLREISNKDTKIDPVNFTREITESNSSKPEIWCVIGNPGSGKSFLCHRTALRFGEGQLPQFIYTIAIPCRTPEWHSMETSQIEAQLAIEGEFIQKWLRLGMPIGPRWTAELAHHIVETDGQDLFLILDGLDEFLREVPFHKTLLFLLLTRRTLTRSTILLTSRPGAYTDISSKHTLRIDRYYHVLGFSPENRDVYFEKQLKDEEEVKLKEWKRLLFLHEEIDQLSLVPVNASLFASLVKESDEVSAQTLSQLYTRLFVYLIRRQLHRMGLQWMAKKSPDLFHLNPAVRSCLREIGEIAYQGVAFRKLTSSARVTLRVERESRDCQCLGLVSEHLVKDSMGGVTNVWAFSHLSLQEFASSFWLCESSWGDQCASVRYIVNSSGSFSLFRMVVRFLCGLLTDRSFRVLYILYKYHPISPVPMLDMPLCYQFCYRLAMHSIMGWTEFTKNYLTVSTLLFETNSDSIFNSFTFFKSFLPESIFFYFEDSTPPPIEWEFFVRSLHLLRSVQLIYIDTRHVSLSQFRSLLSNLTSCALSCLVVWFYQQDYSTISDYSHTIRECQQLSHTKISLKLEWCEFDETESADHLLPIFQFCSSMYLDNNEFTPQSLRHIADQLIHIDNLYIYPSSAISVYEALLPGLNNATQLTGLHLRDIPTESIQLLRTILPKLSNLQEITLHSDTDNPYSLLPYMSSLSSIKYLQLYPDEEPTETEHKDHLIRLLSANSHSLRGLELHYVFSIGLNTCEELFLTLSSCINLVQIKLWYTKLQQDDVTLLSTAVSRLKSLLYLELYEVSLSESAMLHLCRGLLCHSNIRRLELWYCKLNSNCCDLLTQLIPTLSQLNTLIMTGNNLAKPNPDSVTILRKTADIYSVDCPFLS